MCDGRDRSCRGSSRPASRDWKDPSPHRPGHEDRNRLDVPVHGLAFHRRRPDPLPPSVECDRNVSTCLFLSPPRLLSGRSAYSWSASIFRWLVAGVLIGVAGGVGFFIAPPSVRSFLILAVTVLCVGAGAMATYASVRGARAASRERNAGYTTTYGDHPQLWQLDPTTGEVLRQPGERRATRPRSEGGG